MRATERGREKRGRGHPQRTDRGDSENRQTELLSVRWVIYMQHTPVAGC